MCPASARGFTLIEVVISLMIIVLVFGSVSLLFGSLYAQKSYEKEENQLVLNLQELRLQAMQGQEARMVKISSGDRSVTCDFAGKPERTEFPSGVTVGFSGFNRDGTFWFSPSGAPSPRAGTIIINAGGKRVELVINVGTGHIDVQK